MSRRYRVVRASFYLSLVLPLAAVACGQAFSSAPEDGGEDGAESGIILGDGGGGHDATADSGADASRDAPADRTHGDGTLPDSQGVPETGTETGMQEAGCPAGWLTCSDGGCAQLGPTNCGMCGNDCTMLPHVMNAQCMAGQCSFTCEPGWQNCTSNPGAGCATDITRQGNCGACNVTCGGGTPVCSGTGCVSGCDAGATLCNGTCVDTTSDPQNCMTCGNVCPAGPANSQPTCTSGACSFACDNGYTNCSGSCFDLSNDPNHCNGCSTVCPGIPHGQAVCSSGSCGFACDANYQLCNGNSCITIAPDTAAGVFVAQPGVGTSGCGAASAPCSTISAALSVVQSSGGTKNIVYVAHSSMPYLEQVTMLPNVTIQGGWVYLGGGQWSHPCTLDPSQVVIQAPAGSDRVVTATYDGSSTLDTLTIANDNTAAGGTTAQSGQTLYGIFASNAQSGKTSLTLTNVDVAVAGGGLGGSGAQGLPAVDPVPGCSADTGANGLPGPLGAGATSSNNYGPGGYQPQTGGTASMGGTAGHSGSAAPKCGQPNGPQYVDVYPGTTTNNANCCDNGSGTGCIACSGTPTMPYCAGVGAPGCASGGSGPGSGGAGGGASIGVFTYNAAVSLSAVSITTGTGGNGGNGGPGGNVPAPLAPVTGASAKYEETCHNAPINCAQSGTCTCVASTYGTLLGNTGGDAGTGGQGGQGGGGLGGDSVCYATWGTGSVGPSAGLTCSPGAAGAGGNPGQSNAGAPGVAAIHN